MLDTLKKTGDGIIRHNIKAVHQAIALGGIKT